ncbi:hypothetical protein [Nocardia seriolae]|uniref:Lipoprotein n=1 Tax=Nocardia seriolae TaxID=37332 RepID=A0ABC8ATI2_9NOCA|nr:hypothetical protein [Nocardia seriolae]APA97434.1 hypothetical protein NS506_03382 [Nocardia seriolae]MTJ62341.1 hypothetical protein [Nocardia seriolae]MTJ70736.1 hypothetical protein [Nocardia seriolae]MTJ87247.1 hypothetical protein [Nocardia seriolae]MTK31242.1 hypothetical protein [Nocardia seriolae]
MLLLVLAVTLTAFGVGCSDSGERTVESDGAEPVGINKEVTMPIEAMTTTVVDPGAEPRSPLRRTLEPGTTQQVTLSTEHHIEQQINNQALRDISPPSVTIPLTAQAGNDGVALTVGNVTSPDPNLAKALLHADGSQVGFDVNEQGAITALKLAPKPATSDTARAALEQSFYQAVYQSIAFPEEPVGVGAVWTVRQQVSGSVPLEQVTTATLTARDGNQLTIELNVTQTPKSTVWHLPNEAGQLEIVDYLMHGTGTIGVDLGLPLPVSGTVEVGGNQTYRDPRSSVTLRQTLRTEVQWGA